MVTTRSSAKAVTPLLHPTGCANPAIPQDLCPLFLTIPGEVRNRIFSFVLTDYEDETRLYLHTTSYKRPILCSTSNRYSTTPYLPIRVQRSMVATLDEHRTYLLADNSQSCPTKSSSRRRIQKSGTKILADATPRGVQVSLDSSQYCRKRSTWYASHNRSRSSFRTTMATRAWGHAEIFARSSKLLPLTCYHYGTTHRLVELGR